MSHTATEPTSAWVRQAGASARHPPAGQVLLHPIAVAALIVLVANDHLLKRLATSHGQLHSVTGKLSDVAGLIFFPLALVALTDVGLRAADRQRPLHTRSRRHHQAVLAGAATVTGLAFGSIQVLPAAADAYAAGLELLRWLPSAVAARLTGSPAPAATGVNHVMDPTDAWCLPALAVSYRIGWNRLRVASTETWPAPKIRRTRQRRTDG